MQPKVFCIAEALQYMYLVLNCLEEHLCGFCPRVIVYAEGIDFQNLAVKYFF